MNWFLEGPGDFDDDGDCTPEDLDGDDNDTDEVCIG